MRLLAAATLVATAALTACAPVGLVAPQPDASATDGPTLRTASAVFDPVAGDVAGTEACDGLSGREALEVFDRAAWPELGVAAGEATLTCGNADGSGWRHIADGHTGDFGELADEVGASWEDVAWFAIDQALEAPTRVEEYRSDIVNYDVRVELVGDAGDVERAWIVTVGYGLGSSSIITSFPDEVDP
ncbi:MULTISPECIES: hypothetical protein [unclassified Agrococcus]|uniref:hypothetical protein n=1 Tax=unclassified Agrococcus TaxID=2615065 RepID=UPI00361A7D1A